MRLNNELQENVRRMSSNLPESIIRTAIRRYYNGGGELDDIAWQLSLSKRETKDAADFIEGFNKSYNIK